MVCLNRLPTIGKLPTPAHGECRVLVGDDHSADNHGRAVVDRDFGLGGLRVNSRNALNARDDVVDLVVLDGHVHVDRAVGGDLRRHVQFQHSVDELHGNRVVNDGLHRDLGTLLDGSLLVVLRDDLGLREQLADALVFRRGDDHIQRKVRRWKSR